MKLATYKDGSRNGQLVVVARDLSTAHYATGIAHTLQQVLDDWNFLAPQLQDLYVTLNQGKARHAFPFDPRLCMPPLPRPPGVLWAADPPRSGRSDGWRGPVADLPWPAPAATSGTALVALGVITGDIPAATGDDEALESVRLLTLAHAVGASAAGRLADGAADAPWCVAFAPVAVTPDECGAAWERGRLHLPWHLKVEGRAARVLDAASAPCAAGEVLAAAVRDVGLGAGSAVLLPVSATVAASDGPSLHVVLEMRGRDGASVFGQLDQTLVMAE